MLKLFHSPGACSLAPHVLLEEIGAPYEAVRVDLRTGQQRTPEYLRTNWKGKVPALALDDGQILTENGAILPYLADLHPEKNLLPPSTDPLGRARAQEWLAWCASSVQASFGPMFRPSRYHEDEARVKELARGVVQEQFDQLNACLKDRAFALGDRFSVGDPYLLVFYRWGKHLGLTIGADHHRVVASLVERPAVQRSLAQEGLKVEL